MATKKIKPSVFDGFWPDDQLCRSRGFKIAFRPRLGFAIWIRDGRYYPHPLAVEIAKRERQVETQLAIDQNT